MDEKKMIKVSMGTAVCLFIIVILIIALGSTYYLGFVKDNQKSIGLENENNTLNEIAGNISENINTNNSKENIIVDNAREDNENSKYVGKWIDENECSELNILSIEKGQLAFSWAIYRLASIDNTVIPIENDKAEFYFQGYDDKNYNSKQDEDEHFYRRATIQLENTTINIKIENITASEYDITRERNFIADESMYIYNINESNGDNMYNELTSDLGQNEMFGLININKNTDGTYTLYGGIYEEIDSFSANLSNEGYKKVVVPGDTKYVDYYGNETTIKEVYNGSFPREDNELSAKISANSTWLLRFEFSNSKCTLIRETNLAT